MVAVDHSHSDIGNAAEHADVLGTPVAVAHDRHMRGSGCDGAHQSPFVRHLMPRSAYRPPTAATLRDRLVSPAVRLVLGWGWYRVTSSGNAMSPLHRHDRYPVLAGRPASLTR